MFVEELIKDINQVNPLIWFGVPLALFGASARLLLKFNKTHHTDKVNIIDKYDAENFNNVIKPLYATINNLLLEKTLSLGQGPTTKSPTHVKEYEERKKTLLKDEDFSLLEESIEFTELQDQIITSRRNKYDYNGTYKHTRRLLIYGMVAGFVHAVIAALFFIYQQVQYSDFWSKFFVAAWAVVFLVDIVLVVLYVKNESKMDGYIDA